MRIGIIGAGQLGQMLGFAARELGDSCVFLDPADEPPAAAAGDVIKAPFDSTEALSRLASSSDVITYEFENVPVEAITGIADEVPVYPPPAALQQAQDRLSEKQLFERLKIDLPDYRTVDSLADLRRAVRDIGLPLVLKTRRFGYDGKGQYVVQADGDVEPAWQTIGGVPLIAEQWIDFDGEVSAIGARNADGDIAMYPLTQNRHADGILRSSIAPAPDDDRLGDLAGSCLRRMLEQLDYVGVLALELFVIGDRLAANEFAPRVHNSGHWTIEGAETSQFENHIRAITGRSLGSTALRGHAGMLNLIGEIPAGAKTLVAGALHDYGKTPRPGRKLGHITALADSRSELEQMLDSIAQQLRDQPGS